MVRKIGTSVYGLRAPILKQGDNLVDIVVDTVLNSGLEIRDKDVLGITESIVARCEGNYVTIDEVANEIKDKVKNDSIILYKPIYSRNRFAMILKAFARAAKNVYIYMPDVDEVGNVCKNHPFTGLNYDDYYKSIVENEGSKCEILRTYDEFQTRVAVDAVYRNSPILINCLLHDDIKSGEFIVDDFNRCLRIHLKAFNLDDFCSDKCVYGLLGSNKSSEELLKLFPSANYSQHVVDTVQQKLFEKTGKKVEVMVYGDGCFKDPVGGIWEFADPVVSPAYTFGLEGTPNEIKIKNFADEKFKDLQGEELNNAIKEEISHKDSNLKGNMYSQGTTPRRYTDLLGSLMDLTSGSGDKGTPFVYVQGYFDNLASE